MAGNQQHFLAGANLFQRLNGLHKGLGRLHCAAINHLVCLRLRHFLSS